MSNATDSHEHANTHAFFTTENTNTLQKANTTAQYLRTSLRLLTAAILAVMCFIVYRFPVKTILPLQPEITVQQKPLPAYPDTAVVLAAALPEKTAVLATDTLQTSGIEHTTDATVATATAQQFALPLNVRQNQLALAKSMYTLPKFNKDGRPPLSYNGQDPILTAEKWIWKKNLTAAKVILDSIKVTHKDYNAAQRLVAHIDFLSDKIAPATHLFYMFSLNADPKVADGENDWYLLLCYLADYQTKKAAFEALGADISNNPNHTFHNQTVGLMAKVRILKQEGKM